MFIQQFVLIIVFLILFSSQSRADEGEIQLLSIIFRHGARTTTSFYTNDPNKNETLYPYGKGELTNEGKLGEFRLGKFLRSEYDEFLGADYTNDKVYIKTTDLSRTKMSAELVMAGLFPPSAILTWNSDLLWIPVPVNYKESSEEEIFHRTDNCPFKTAVIKDLKNINEVNEKYIEPFEEIYKYVEENTGDKMSVPTDMAKIFFILKSEEEMNLTLPEWTSQVYPEKLEAAAAVAYDYHNYNKEVKKINSGYMLKRILDDAEAKIKGTISPSQRKIMLYSGQETTVGYMLSALNLDQSRVPSYGSALSFELRKLDDQYYIKLKLRNDPDALEAIDLTVQGCDTLCPFEKFKEIYKDLLPSLSINDACNQEYNK